MGYLNRLWAYGFYRGSKLLRRMPNPLKQFATEKIVVAPASNGSYPPPVTLEGQIERATDNLWEPLDIIIGYATQTALAHKETLLYRVDEVTIDNGFIFQGSKAQHISSLGTPKLSKTNQVDEGILCSTSSGSLYFGCWMFDDNLLESISANVGTTPIKITPHKNYMHLPGINNKLGLSNTYLKKTTKFDHLYIPEDIGYNPNKVDRIMSLRSKYNVSKPIDNAPKKYIYLKRGTGANARILSNEEEIIQYLKLIGFKIIDPEQYSVNELIKETSNCDIVLGVEGSQQVFGIFGLKEGGYLLELMPPWHFQATHRPRCEAVGVRWGFLVGIENEEGFEIPLDDIKKIMDKVL